MDLLFAGTSLKETPKKPKEPISQGPVPDAKIAADESHPRNTGAEPTGVSDSKTSPGYPRSSASRTPGFSRCIP